MSIGYNNMFISNTLNTKFFGLFITNSLNWKDHFTQLHLYYVKHVMYLDVLDRLCLMIHWNLYTIPTFIPFLAAV